MLRHCKAPTIISLWLWAACAATSALAAAGVPPGGQSVLAPGVFGGFYSAANNPMGSQEIVTVQGMEFAQAIRTTGKAVAQNRWDFQLQTLTAADVSQGDILLASFWLRCLQTQKTNGTCQTAFVFQMNGEPWTDVVNRPISVGSEWQQFFVRFQSTMKFPAGKAKMAFRLGYDQQTLEFADIRVANHRKTKKQSQLPNTRVTYEGRSKDASWRALAEERILNHRVAGLNIGVVDQNGRPVRGASVHVRQKRSAFKWGAAVQERFLKNKPPLAGSQAAKYQKIIKEWFNAATAENALKSPALHGDWDDNQWGDETDQWGFDVAMEATGWLHRHGFFQRGHALVWPGWSNSPKEWKRLSQDPIALENQLLDHIHRLGTAMAGRIHHWDVVNEPYTNSDITQLLGEKSLVTWFKAAKSADPSAKLFLNDFLILEGGSGDTDQRKKYEATIQYLLDNGAPVEGLGMQGHFAEGLTGMNDLQTIVDRYSRFKLPIYVTEYDIAIEDLELAGDYTRDFLTLMYSNPQVGGVINWEFWDGHHENGTGTYFHQDWTLKPAGRVWKELVLGKWKTKKTLVSDTNGWVHTDGHLGDYEVVARKGRLRAIGQLTLQKPGSKLVLVLK